MQHWVVIKQRKCFEITMEFNWKRLLRERILRYAFAPTQVDFTMDHLCEGWDDLNANGMLMVLSSRILFDLID